MNFKNKTSLQYFSFKKLVYKYLIFKEKNWFTNIYFHRKLTNAI